MKNDYRFMSEVLRIIHGALDLDIDKVRNYTEFLAEKLEKEGEEGMARRLRELLENPGRHIHPSSAGSSDADPPDVVLQGRASAFDPKDVAGAWPGDEPIEELLSQLD